eukprot:10707001-Alexandrium_andersonii.AAC.1
MVLPDCGSDPISRAARAAPIPGLVARSRSRAASKSRPGRLVDGVPAVDVARGRGVELLRGAGVGVPGH